MCNATDREGRQTHVMGVVGHQADDEAVKRTNEIKMAIPLLGAIDIQGKDISTDALLTRRYSRPTLLNSQELRSMFFDACCLEEWLPLSPLLWSNKLADRGHQSLEDNYKGI